MSAPIEIRDWVDATRPMRSAVQEALQRLREVIEGCPRITGRSLPLELDADAIHTRIETALTEHDEPPVRVTEPAL